MRTSRNVLIGIIIILVGFTALFNTLNINFNVASLIGPLIFFVLGLFFYQKNRRVISAIFFFISVIALFEHVFRINILGVIIAIAFIYFGYRLLIGKKKRYKEDWVEKEMENEVKEKFIIQQEPVNENNHERQK